MNTVLGQVPRKDKEGHNFRQSQPQPHAVGELWDLNSASGKVPT